MPTSDERIKVLKMIQEGRITAEEGLQLLEVLEQSSSGTSSSPSEPAATGSRVARWFRVRITDTNTGKTRVNIRLPVSLVESGFKMGAKFSPEVEGLDGNQLMSLIKGGKTGQVVDIIDDEDSEHVEVFLE